MNSLMRMLAARRQRIREAWNKVYENVDSIPLLPWVNTALPDYLLDEFVDKIGDKTNIRILDFGCGTGRLGKYVADKYPNCDVYYYDISIKALDYCINYGDINRDKIVFPTDEPEDLFEENQFEGIISWGMFHHTDPEDWEEYRDIICNILKPGGILFFGDFTQDDELFKGDGKRISEITNIESYAVCNHDLFSEKLNIIDEGLFPFVENNLKRNRVINYIIGRKWN